MYYLRLPRAQIHEHPPPSHKVGEAHRNGASKSIAHMSEWFKMLKPPALMLAISLILSFTAASAERHNAGGRDISAHEELTQAHFTIFKDSVQEQLRIVQNRVHEQEKLLDLQTARISDLTISLTLFGITIAMLAVISGWLGFVTVRDRAKEEAKQTAADWFKNDGKNLIDDMLAEFKRHLDAEQSKVSERAKQVMEEMQLSILATQQGIGGPLEKDVQGMDPLLELVEQLKHKPESDYAFADWNARAFDSYRQGKLALAAEYWLRAATAKNPTHLEVATSTLNAAVALRLDDKQQKALELFDHVLDQVGTAVGMPLRGIFAGALANKGIALAQLNRCDDAIRVCDDVIGRFGMATELPLREAVAMAMFAKSDALLNLNRLEETIRVCDDMIGRFGTAAELPLRIQVTAITNAKGFAQILLAKQQWADLPARGRLLEAAIEQLGRALSGVVEADRPFALGNLAYAHFLLGHLDEARKALSKALQQGGKILHDAEIKDTERFPVLEDNGFRALIDAVWSDVSRPA